MSPLHRGAICGRPVGRWPFPPALSAPPHLPSRIAAHLTRPGPTRWQFVLVDIRDNDETRPPAPRQTGPLNDLAAVAWLV